MRFFPDIRAGAVESEAFRTPSRRAIRGRCPVLVPVRVTATPARSVQQRKISRRPSSCWAVTTRSWATAWPRCNAGRTCTWTRVAWPSSAAVETVVRRSAPSGCCSVPAAPARPIQAPLNAVLTAGHLRRAAACDSGGQRRVDCSDFRQPRSSCHGRRVARDLIDVHAHVGSLGFPVPSVDPGEHARSCAPYGIERSIASSLRAIVDDVVRGQRGDAASVRAGWRCAARLRRAQPQRPGGSLPCDGRRVPHANGASAPRCIAVGAARRRLVADDAGAAARGGAPRPAAQDPRRRPRLGRRARTTSPRSFPAGR